MPTSNNSYMTGLLVTVAGDTPGSLPELEHICELLI